MKKNIWFGLVILSLLCSACASGVSKTSPGGVDQLKVSDGSKTKVYAVSDLKKIGATEASFKGVAYVGVTVKLLLEEAGFTPGTLKAVKAIASDGFTVNYDPPLFMREDMIVAYATRDGPMSAEDGVFRIVLPDAEGKMNPRMLVELQVLP
jgi:hypothetical protein